MRGLRKTALLLAPALAGAAPVASGGFGNDDRAIALLRLGLGGSSDRQLNLELDVSRSENICGASQVNLNGQRLRRNDQESEPGIFFTSLEDSKFLTATWEFHCVTVDDLSVEETVTIKLLSLDGGSEPESLSDALITVHLNQTDPAMITAIDGAEWTARRYTLIDGVVQESEASAKISPEIEIEDAKMDLELMRLHKAGLLHEIAELEGWIQENTPSETCKTWCFLRKLISNVTTFFRGLYSSLGRHGKPGRHWPFPCHGNHSHHGNHTHGNHSWPHPPHKRPHWRLPLPRPPHHPNHPKKPHPPEPPKEPTKPDLSESLNTPGKVLPVSISWLGAEQPMLGEPPSSSTQASQMGSPPTNTPDPNKPDRHHHGLPFPIRLFLYIIIVVTLFSLIRRGVCRCSRKEKPREEGFIARFRARRRRRVEQAAARQRRREAIKTLFRAAIRRIFTRPCSDDEEKASTALHTQYRERSGSDSSTTMEQSISQFRQVASVVGDMVAAEEGRVRREIAGRDERIQAELSRMAARMAVIPPAYVPAEEIPPPAYETDEEEVVVADGFRYTPGSSRYTPGSSRYTPSESVSGSDALGYSKP